MNDRRSSRIRPLDVHPEVVGHSRASCIAIIQRDGEPFDECPEGTADISRVPASPRAQHPVLAPEIINAPEGSRIYESSDPESAAPRNIRP